MVAAGWVAVCRRVLATLRPAGSLVTPRSFSLSFLPKNTQNILSLCQYRSLHATVSGKGLEEFFDDPKNWGEEKVKSGASWTCQPLRKKSNDLRELWYVLLPERNMLLTLEQEAKRQGLPMPSPERLDKPVPCSGCGSCPAAVEGRGRSGAAGVPAGRGRSGLAERNVYARGCVSGRRLLLNARPWGAGAAAAAAAEAAWGPEVNTMSSLHKSRIADFQDVLKEPSIALEKLRELSFSGIPCEGGLRCLCWKILLNYLPSERASWTSILAKQRELYAQFLREMIIQPGIAKANMGVSREDVTFEDHPLNPNPDSRWNTYFKDNEVLLQIDKDVRRWNTYFKDNEVLLQIDKDVRRLCPDISFFQRATEYPCLLILDPQNEFETLRKRVEQTTLKSQTVARNRSGVTNMSSPHKNSAPPSLNEYEVLPNGCEAHWEVVERILFIYAKLNPGIAYVQGMNEIVGPLYYTFATDPNSEWKEHAEADTFFCFTNLMAEIRDNFIKSLDDSQCGITYKMEKVYSTLKDKDVELYLRLQEQNIKPQFFAFRWLTLLLSQEFLLPDVIRIWDSLFADDNRFDFLLLVCCAMLILIREQLLEGDFTVNMRLLQDYPISDVCQILQKAKELQDSK
ncbi:TBC1 domain family member 13 [Tupaia chinensis]|uniref:TBC1 domain family member 13 n=2 Tax=Euarchontoglires TaxID=314146 RepID=L9KGI8_TUPCH|nr:TBC1 domain family member 13 [Tupaia chinensis]